MTWHKFDKSDKSTWPPILNGCRVSDYVILRNDEDCYCVGYRSQTVERNSILFSEQMVEIGEDMLDHDFQEMEFDKWTADNVTHWMEIPEIEEDL